MTSLGVDFSHYQNRPDVGALKAQGVEYVGLKAWEADAPDPDYTVNVANCINNYMPVWAYVYLHDTDKDARMQKCFDFIGPDIVLALDWEEGDVPASVVEAWQDAYEARYGRPGIIYYGMYPPDEATPRIGEWPRWFPRYNSYPGLAPWDGQSGCDWRNCYLIWQDSASGEFDGMSANNPFDTNELAPGVTANDFAAWLNGGKIPQPSPQLPQPPTLKMGDTGPWVRKLQRELWVPWLPHDGDFGQATDYIVRSFQTVNTLTVDGIVGPATWAKLREGKAAYHEDEFVARRRQMKG